MILDETYTLQNGVTIPQFCIKYTLQLGTISLPKSSNPEHIRSNVQLDWYEDFNEQNIPCPFVGEIQLDRSSARLIAEIKVIIPCSREFVEEEIEDGL